MKTLRYLLASALLTLGLVAPLAIVATTGCKATPHQVAYKSADAVVSSVDIAMRGWADYVVGERKRIAALPLVDQLDPKADLLRKEGRVMNAYGDYQRAMTLAESAVKLAITNHQPPPAAVASAASIVLDVIKANR
jgi:hypothetical protein